MKKIVQTPQVTLYAAISGSATTARITPYPLDLDGNKLTMDDFGDIGYCTMDPKVATYEEINSFTGLTDNGDNTGTLTGLVRNLTGKYPYTTPGTGKAHGASSVVVFSNNPQKEIEFAYKSNDETISGSWLFPVPVAAQNPATKAYVDALVFGGSVTTDRFTVTGIAGETVAAGNVVYLKAADGRWWKADADLTATIDNVQLGIAQGAGTAGGSISGGVLLRGLDTNNTGTAGALVYVSNTAGALSTTTGTLARIVGQYKPSSGGLYFDPNFYYSLTGKQLAALAGTQGDPSSTNKYVTGDNTSAAGTDQSQTTQNSTIEVGEASVTLKKNLIVQSFIPTKTKIRGVKLYKGTDTGTFTGNVVVKIQADSAGNPSGSDLITGTITNAQWLALSNGEFTALFSAEISLTQGSLYWICILPSTADTSNHPNLGVNTAGGYANGTLKYSNATDGYVAVATTDLYFKTMDGINSQVPVTNSSGKIPSDFIDTTSLPVPVLQQTIALYSNMGGGGIGATGASADGSVIYIAGTGSTMFERYQRDAITGQYILTHRVDFSIPANSGMAVLNGFVYIFYDNGVNVGCQRFSAADLTGSAAMTFATVAIPATGSAVIAAWTDGVYLYLVSNTNATTTVKLSVSGTNLTQVNTFTNAGSAYFVNAWSSSMFDGSNIYTITPQTSGLSGARINKLTDSIGSAITSSTDKYQNGYSDSTVANFILIPIDTTRCYIGFFGTVYNATVAIKTYMFLVPVTKP